MSEDYPTASDDEFNALVSGIDTSSDVDSETLDGILAIVNSYESLLLALCPTEYSANLLGTQQHCYIEAIAIEDVSEFDPSESEAFDMSEFEHFDTMFFRWRAGNLFHIWNGFLAMPPISWGVVLKLAFASLVQALRQYRLAVDNPENGGVDKEDLGTIRDTFEMFSDMSPFVANRSEASTIILGDLKEFITDELEQRIVGTEYEANFEQQMEDSILQLLQSSLSVVSECLFDIMAVTAEILMCTSKLYVHETPDDHHNYIKAFCTSSRERIVESFYE